MSGRNRGRRSATWTVVRGGTGDAANPTSTACANCGNPTGDTILGESLSVLGRDGGRRLAPPMPLCETCRRDVIFRRGWLPTWCGECQSWQPFGHGN